MSWLLDTNVVSELVRPRPAPALVGWFKERAGVEQRIFLSALTFAEIHRGILRMNRGSPRYARLYAWANGELPARFAGRILAFDVGVARTWGEMTARLPRRANVPNMDSLIAAIAHHHNLVLVTRNERDFGAFADLVVENPWR